MEIDALQHLADSLSGTKDLNAKLELLLNFPIVEQVLSKECIQPYLPHEHDIASKVAVCSIIAINQHFILFAYPNKNPPKEKIRALHSLLVSIDRFYETIGGIVGYHLNILKLLDKKLEQQQKAKQVFSRAPGINLAVLSKQVDQAVWEGICALDEVAEMYPMGGLGTRLKLINKKGEAQPVACLLFCGRTLLEGLVRDVQTREFLYFRLFNRQITIPIAMMTSLEKKNAPRIEAICKKNNWFGRPKESFRLFSQISVPVVTQEGKWSMKAPLEINVQPGGHGALWKAAEECGVFFWFESLEKEHVLIRQINNPIAGLDYGLLALLGIGKQEKKVFGFASCERLSNTAEGVLVLVEENGTKRLSNIEYTDFKQHGIKDLPSQEGYSAYPANTNILYAHLKQIIPVIKKNPLPGLMLNMKNKEPFLCPLGKKSIKFGGRLESMMQNISDALQSPSHEPLPSFLTYNERKRTISVAKTSFEVGGKLLETPPGAFYDLLLNAYELLQNWCGAKMGPFCSQNEYLEKGPSHFFIYHPALGPLFSLIGQKIHKITLANGSELQLEIADVVINNLNLEGSLFVFAKNILGHNSQGIIRYSHNTGKCVLKNVNIKNKGINRKAKQCYWKNQITRQEVVKIILHGHSEFYAENVQFNGNQTIEVPHGQRWVACQDSLGRISYRVEKPGWKWEYKEENHIIKFDYHCNLSEKL